MVPSSLPEVSTPPHGLLGGRKGQDWGHLKVKLGPVSEKVNILGNEEISKPHYKNQDTSERVNRDIQADRYIDTES